MHRVRHMLMKTIHVYSQVSQQHFTSADRKEHISLYKRGGSTKHSIECDGRDMQLNLRVPLKTRGMCVVEGECGPLVRLMVRLCSLDMLSQRTI